MVVRGVWYKLVALVSVILYIYFIYTQQKKLCTDGISGKSCLGQDKMQQMLYVVVYRYHFATI